MRSLSLGELAFPLSCSRFSAEVSASLVRVYCILGSASPELLLLRHGMLPGVDAAVDGVQGLFGNKQTPSSSYFLSKKFCPCPIRV